MQKQYFGWKIGRISSISVRARDTEGRGWEVLAQWGGVTCHVTKMVPPLWSNPQVPKHLLKVDVRVTQNFNLGYFI